MHTIFTVFMLLGVFLAFKLIVDSVTKLLKKDNKNDYI